MISPVDWSALARHHRTPARTARGLGRDNPVVMNSERVQRFQPNEIEHRPGEDSNGLVSVARSRHDHVFIETDLFGKVIGDLVQCGRTASGVGTFEVDEAVLSISVPTDPPEGGPLQHALFPGRHRVRDPVSPRTSTTGSPRSSNGHVADLPRGNRPRSRRLPLRTPLRPDP